MILFLNIVAYKVKPPYVTTKRWPSKTPRHPQTLSQSPIWLKPPVYN